MRRALILLFVLSMPALAPTAAQQVATKPAMQPAPAAAAPQKPDAAPATVPAPRPMELADIIAWKNIGAPAASNDGKWLAYRMSPLEGDSEVFIRATESEKVYTFPVGEAPSMEAGPAGLAKGAHHRHRSASQRTRGGPPSWCTPRGRRASGSGGSAVPSRRRCACSS